MDPREQVFFEKGIGCVDDYRAKLARDLIDDVGPTPEVLFGWLRYHIGQFFFRWQHPYNSIAIEELHKRVGQAQELMESVEGELKVALMRLIWIRGATLLLETEPSPAQLVEAAEALDAFEGRMSDSWQPWEEEWLKREYQDLRSRHRVWVVCLADECIPERDFAFVLQASAGDLQWALDPLVARKDFQEWARSRIQSNETLDHQEEEEDFGIASMISTYRTVTGKLVKPLNLGRMYVCLLLGESPQQVMRGLIGEQRSGSTPLLKELFKLCGDQIDPNHIMREGCNPPLYTAAVCGDHAAVTQLLGAGANPSPTGYGPLHEEAKGKKTSELLREAIGASS